MAHYYKVVDENGVPCGICVGSGKPHPAPLPKGYSEISYEDYESLCESLDFEA